MIKQEVQFAVQTQKGIVTAVGRFSVHHPKPRRNGDRIKWYQDKVKPDQAEMKKGGARK